METKFTIDINGTKVIFNSLQQAQEFILSHNQMQVQMYIQQSQAQMQMSKIQLREAERKKIKNSRKQKLQKLNW